MIYLNQLVSDIIKIIHNQLDFPSQCNLRLVSTRFLIFPITNLFDNVPNINRLTNAICQSYPHTIKLNSNYNRKIMDINQLINLQILYAMPNKCGIDNDGIKHLTNLTELYVADNCKITDINHLINLRILNAGYDCGINNNGIKQLTNLTTLYANSNYKITNISHLTKLRIFHSANNHEITDDQISSLTNLTDLRLRNNTKITNSGISTLVNLQILDISNRSGTGYDYVHRLTNITNLNGINIRRLRDYYKKIENNIYI